MTKYLVTMILLLVGCSDATEILQVINLDPVNHKYMIIKGNNPIAPMVTAERLCNGKGFTYQDDSIRGTSHGAMSNTDSVLLVTCHK